MSTAGLSTVVRGRLCGRQPGELLVGEPRGDQLPRPMRLGGGDVDPRGRGLSEHAGIGGDPRGDTLGGQHPGK